MLAGGVAEHESALERDFVTLAAFTDAGAVITAQPITLLFRDGARTRRYTPDFLVRWSDGRSTLVEIKYRTDLRENWAQLRPGFVAARSWAREHEAVFRIATERGIRGALLGNAKRLLPLRTAPIDSATSLEVFRALRSLREATFGQLVDAVPGNRAVVLGVLWRLIARGTVRVDLSAPIRVETRVALP